MKIRFIIAIFILIVSFNFSCDTESTSSEVSKEAYLSELQIKLSSLEANTKSNISSLNYTFDEDQIKTNFNDYDSLE